MIELIIWGMEVLRRIIVTGCSFNKLCGSHLQSQVIVLSQLKFKNPGALKNLDEEAVEGCHLSDAIQYRVSVLGHLGLYGIPQQSQEMTVKLSIIHRSELALISSRAASYSSAFRWFSFLAKRNSDCNNSNASYLLNIAAGRFI